MRQIQLSLSYNASCLQYKYQPVNIIARTGANAKAMVAAISDIQKPLLVDY